MIDLTIHPEGLAHNVLRAREKGIVIPTFAQMRDPSKVPEEVLGKLKRTGLWDVDPVNLFRITWKNEPTDRGGLFGKPNYIELPTRLTGVPARIVALVGKWFPTGCHKVGASFGCLVPRLVTGQFDASWQKAVWPSTGNYCRGGAFNSKLLDVNAIAILPEGMSRERFDWLRTIVGEIIATPGCESNVKEIFDKSNELKKLAECVIFNQFEEMGNHLWHYEITGNAMAEVMQQLGGNARLAGACFTTGSAGAIGAGDRLKELYPAMKLAACEALQCPTLLQNGFGEHRIEGIGDKHVPWIHNVRNTDMVIAIDDEDSQRLLALFNEPQGRAFAMEELGLTQEEAEQLGLFGISGIANLLSAIKMAKYYEFTEQDVVFTVLTDTAEMYRSRVEELREQYGEYTPQRAAMDYALRIAGQKTDNMLELTYPEKKRIHNLKYYTWVEQQGKTAQELNALWYDPEGTWGSVHKQAAEIDALIDAFNEAVRG
ncbi:MAG TPA: pyridoxal-5-phosphate-dependent protein subunit beta [Candidatus Aphodomonas merdavium]|nr:pyridoxal-5-phosphate-dependent protein subunit beta [Candidatus Aphodomonas merdavium]